ncbi:DUF6221 family protein [Streptomyces sp. NPDC059582]|uniref:DUF6221 family protein n=1 Tax=Streptomyces sp. NPDC059582 TaxID=3346875 RepID=UPI0036C94B98
MDDPELTVRVIAASGPPAVDDLTTFLRKRIADDRAALESAPASDTDTSLPQLGFVARVNGSTMAYLPLARFSAHLNAMESTLDKFDAALSHVLRGKQKGWDHNNAQVALSAYMDVIKLHAQEYAVHPNYKENWRP